MLAECAESTRDSTEVLTPGFISSFEIYPVGMALSWVPLSPLFSNKLSPRLAV